MAQPKDFGFGGEEAMLRDSARKFLDEHCNVEKLRALVAGNPEPNRDPECLWDEKAWGKAVELGWTTLAVPESAGGVGMPMVAVAALAEEVGRHAFPSPLIPTILATLVLRECAGEGAKAMLAKIAEGEPITLAATNADASWNPAHTPVSAKGAGEVTLSGTAYFVQDARKARHFLVGAKGDKGLGWYVVAADAPGVTITPDGIIDLTRDQARVTFKDVKVSAANTAAASGEGEKAYAKALPGLLTVIAADLVGASEWALKTTVEYAKIRVQFDRPIGFFQAVKHPLVDVMIANDQARSLVYNAACAIDTEPEQALLFARMAKAAACDAGQFSVDRAIQYHGGIGFTWECDVHLYFKRNKHNQFLLGDAMHHRKEIAKLVLD